MENSNSVKIQVCAFKKMVVSVQITESPHPPQGNDIWFGLMTTYCARHFGQHWFRKLLVVKQATITSSDVRIPNFLFTKMHLKYFLQTASTLFQPQCVNPILHQVYAMWALVAIEITKKPHIIILHLKTPSAKIRLSIWMHLMFRIHLHIPCGKLNGVAINTCCSLHVFLFAEYGCFWIRACAFMPSMSASCARRRSPMTETTTPRSQVISQTTASKRISRQIMGNTKKAMKCSTKISTSKFHGWGEPV